jgi:hypothetical protein
MSSPFPVVSFHHPNTHTYIHTHTHTYTTHTTHDIHNTHTQRGTQHQNRFVREISYFTCCTVSEIENSQDLIIKTFLADIISVGLGDNWSQVCVRVRIYIYKKIYIWVCE